MDNVSLADFWEMLNKHDWYHMMSDDIKVDRSGAADMAKLAKIAKQSPEHEAMLQGFHQHFWSGKPWNTEVKPKPERPA